MNPLRKVGFIYVLFFLFFVFFMVFGVLNVVVGMFVETASAVAQRDHDVVVENEISRVQEYSENIKEFFTQADKDKSGELTWEEFSEHLKDERVKAYFASLELDVSQAKMLFHLLDIDGTGGIGVDEFVGGCMRLKGLARSIDVNMMIFEMDKMMSTVTTLASTTSQKLDGIERFFGITSTKGPDVAVKGEKPSGKKYAEDMWVGAAKKGNNSFRNLVRKKSTFGTDTSISSDDKSAGKAPHK
mmetsp:Transcript_62704/g.127741  ORF Transcript_62704/g.127741 Transcript_62704/m.127741 type:complete len:243 (+) Transcript_62704:2-730(+)